MRVLESFGNCPKYIQARDVSYAPERRSAGAATCTPGLDADSRRIVAAADTLFIATAHPDAGVDAGIAWGVDVSHRGGKPGFVRIASAGEGAQARLTLPDFVGNAFFNTFGNLVLNPRVGLLFIDFAGGDLDYFLQDPGLVQVDAGARGASVLRKFVVANPAIRGMRAMLDVQFEKGTVGVARASLRSGGKLLSETWTYAWRFYDF